MAKAPAIKNERDILVLHGIITLIFGVVAIFWPGLTLLALLYIFGAYILVSGIFNVIHGVSSIEKTKWWSLTTILGVLELGVGVYLLRHTLITFKTLIILIGLILIIRGIIQLTLAIFNEFKDNVSRALSGIFGLLAIVAGIIVLYQKVSGGVAFVWILGVYAIIVGAIQLSAARKLGEL